MRPTATIRSVPAIPLLSVGRVLLRVSVSPCLDYTKAFLKKSKQNTYRCRRGHFVLPLYGFLSFVSHLCPLNLFDMRTILSLLFFVLFSTQSLWAQDTALVMSYNLLQFPGDNPERIADLKAIVHEVKPDVLMVCELQTNEASVTILTQALNTNGVGYYQRAPFLDNGDFNNMLYYNTKKYKLLKQDTVSGWPRFATVYQLIHKGALAAGDSVVSTFIMVHLKAGDTDAAARAKMAKHIRWYIDNETNGQNIFLAGDFNLYSPTEGAFQTFINKGKYPLNDPINEIGEWSNNEYYAPIHTQSTRTEYFGGGSTGGLDDRFDFILTSKDVLDGTHSINYLLGSYKAFGNDGNHFNQSVNFKTNEVVSAEIADHLHEMSDHLPVIMRVVIDFTNAVAPQPLSQITLRSYNQTLLVNGAEDWQTVELYNLQGQQIAVLNNAGRLSNMEIPLNGFSGMVLAKFSNAQQMQVFRVLVR
ncbi:hypothetical protein GC194_07835 [bacterium]|nr:hypothetical protein [bacterium]